MCPIRANAHRRKSPYLMSFWGVLPTRLPKQLNTDNIDALEAGCMTRSTTSTMNASSWNRRGSVR